MKYYIYKHTSPSGKVYIGQTCKEPRKRWSNGYGYKTQLYFYRAIQKYGWDNFEHEILYECDSKQEADKREIEMISFYNATNRNFGYNISLGGGGTTGVKHSNKTKEKISNSHKGKTRSYDSRIKQSQTMQGHFCSEETRKKIGKANNNRVWSDKSREKLRKSNLGKTLSKETKDKISCSSKGRIPSQKNREVTAKNNRNRIWSKESRTKSSNSHKGQIAVNKKPVLCVETGIIYDSSSEASRKCNINRSAISMVCENKRKTVGGKHWQFFNCKDI